MPGDRAMQRFLRCIRRERADTRAEFGPGLVSNLRWTMGAKHSGAGPTVAAAAVLDRRARRGPPRLCTTERFEMYRIDPIPPGLTLRHARPPFDLRVRPRLDISGMCPDTTMRPCRQDSRNTRPARMLRRSVAPTQQEEVRKASSLTGMRSNRESQDEQAAFRLVRWVVVGLPGLEPGTSSLSAKCR
jgi:hypothetical protein